ncbi:ABC transporter substrate-binding protein [Rhodanobacter aciditrophus]|uniref:ABC transporter substrate-binding protein n=1 Tax=Rhodanobacter aciditrophus TaxID=1623218 RepID=A0ABW4B2I0_9GAMM
MRQSLQSWSAFPQALMVRNPHYWDQASNGNVERLELIPIRSDSTRLAALLTGDVDIISPVAPIDLERVKRTPDVDVFHMSGTRIVMLQMNELRRPEFKDVRVRRAMNLAINQSLIVEKILRGYGEAAAQLSAETFLGHVDAIQPEYDLAEAKALMKAAGYEDGFRVSMMAPNNRYMGDEKVAQAAAAMLEKINIKVDLKTFPKAQYFQLYDQRAADIMMLGWQSDTFDSNNIYEFVLACADPKTGFGAYNASNYCNDVIDSDIRSANREMNPERRVRELRQIEMKAYEQAAVIPLFWQPIIWAARSNIELSSVVNFLNFPYWGDLYIE